ncbi:MAG: IrrE N-terminal-like domain [Pyrinomonadaceae bacterium]|nr:IrrE N-terminal-like domain [Pyrinomonadaceae bacterium]
MKLLAKAIRGYVPYWNERPLTEADFYRLCRKFKVRVIEVPLRVPGLFMQVGDKRCLYVNSRLGGVDWLHAALHEMGHALLHTPPSGTVAYFFRLPPNSKREHEAEAFAAVALIPLNIVMTKLPWEIQEEYGYPTELIELRKRIYDNFRI